MALITCKECGDKVSSEAKTCPHCGITLKEGTIYKANKITDHIVGKVNKDNLSNINHFWEKHSYRFIPKEKSEDEIAIVEKERSDHLFYKSLKSDSSKTISLKEKNIPLAIGLNILLPGLGYMYMGKVIIGIAALLLIICMYLITALFTIIFTWFVMNVIMAIDMLILADKNKKIIEEQTMMKCPSCAELVKKEATICKHCRSSLT